MIRLKTARLIIRDPLASDIGGWHRLLSDSETMYYLQDIMTSSQEESYKNLAVAISEAQNPDRKKYFFTIEHDQTGVFIGTVGYTVTQKTPHGKFAGLGYFILSEYHGQGYMTEAVKEVIRFAFEDDGVYRISTGCLTENYASEGVMQKCGFIKEAELKSFTWHDGAIKDRVEYRLLGDEWKSARKIMNADFWNALDKLIAESKVIIDRHKGSRHPKYPDYIYPLDYGYLENTTAMDGGGIDVWKGSDGEYVDAVICTVDLLKKDSEIKILIGCNEEEKRLVFESHNNSEFMKGILIRRGEE